MGEPQGLAGKFKGQGIDVMTMKVTVKGIGPLLYTQHLHSFVSLSLRAQQIKEINVHKSYAFIPEPPSIRQPVVRNMCCLSLTHNNKHNLLFKPIHTKPVNPLCPGTECS